MDEAAARAGRWSGGVHGGDHRYISCRWFFGS
jgi:hypothetical protein